jgi:hypothetical protein
VAQAQGWKDGSPQKIALHGLAGLIAAKVGDGNGVAGALGGIAQEVLTGELSTYLKENGFDYAAEGLTPEERALLKNEHDSLLQLGVTLAGAAVGVVAGGEQGAADAATAAYQGVTYNRMLHEGEKARIKELADGDRDKEIRLTAAACALTACYAEYPEGSDLYNYYWNLALAGAGFTEEYQLLKAQSGLFEYTEWNRFFDWNRYINNNYQVVDRGIGALQAAGGSMEVGVAAITSPVVCGATLTVGCVATGLVGANGIDNAITGSKRLISGVPQDTYLNQALQALGLSPETASYAEMTLGLGSAVAMSNAALKSLTQASAASRAARGTYDEVPQIVVNNQAVAKGTATEVEVLSGSKLSHINGSIGELRGYQSAIDDLGHIGIKQPGKVTARGPDFITYDPKGGDIFVWDAKYRAPSGTYPSTVPASKVNSWLPHIQEAIQNMPPGATRNAAMNALQNGRIRGEVFKWPN